VLERAGGNGRKFPDPEVVATIAGGVGRGRIKKTEGRTGMPRWVTVLIGGLACVSLAEPFALSLLDHDVPLDCAGGTLTLVGSTAFGPVPQEAAGSYEKTCTDAHFVLDLNGSVEGLRALDDAGRELTTQNGAGMRIRTVRTCLRSPTAKEGNRALGYSELGSASGRENLLLLRIDGHEATLQGANYGAYPFWQTEYAYTYGQPTADSS
jgi:ABC-type phosphate transport system substrate-binding protein